jgi:uncharacterized membrane protein YbhN (UPF0104 family)
VSEPTLTVRILRRVLQATVAGVTLAYVAAALWRNWDDVARLEFRPSPLLLGGALVLALSYLVGRGLLWHQIATRLVGSFPRRVNVACWLASMLGKYLPGKVFSLLGRAYVYRIRGASATHVAVGFLVELMVLYLTTGLLFAAATLTIDMAVPPALQRALLIAALLLLLLAHPKVLRWGLRGLGRLRKVELEATGYRFADGLLWTIHMAAIWAVLGVGFYLLACSLVDLPLRAVPRLTAAFALAGVAGITAVFAPAGIGVREGVLTLLLAPMLGAGPAAALAVLARLWMTVAEVAAALAAGPLLRPERERGARR